MHISKLEKHIKEKTSHEKDMSMLYKQVLFAWDKFPSLVQGKLAMFNYAELAPNGWFSQHHHGSENPEVGMVEVFYIIKGNARFKINEKEYEVDDNTLIMVEKGEIHSMKNNSETDPVIYIVFGISNGGNTTVVKEHY